MRKKMQIKEILKKKITFSMEVFPPKKESDIQPLFEIMKELKKIQPDFISVTYGAGGSTQRLTQEIALQIKKQIGIESMEHFTCVGSDKKEIGNILDSLYRSGIENILALRGDPPLGQKEFQPHPNGFAYASQLIEWIKKEKDFFSIGAACYPEKHPEAKTLEQDIENLKKKVDAGADFLITQLFFDNSLFFSFLEKIRKKDITLPILAGIFLVSNFKQLSRIIEIAKPKIPQEFYNQLEKYQDDYLAIQKIGLEFALQQSQELLKSKAIQGLHFYIMNKKEQILPLYEELRKSNPELFKQREEK